ncbi:MAG: two-component system sensor histidine kinase NtrB [Candidatus Methylomirabilales bacterium]
MTVTARPNPGRPEISFAVLRFLTLAGGVVALLLIPLHPEHKPHLPPLLVFFLAYNGLFAIPHFLWPTRWRALFIGTLAFDLAFVFFLVWFTGGLESHFYLLFYLLIALNAYSFGAAVGIAGAAGAALLYLANFALSPLTSLNWTHLAARVATFGLLGISLGFLSERERRARAEMEQLNLDLEAKSRSLQQAYRELQEAQERTLQAERLATIGRMAAKIAHEVRNPLGAISLNLELLEDGVRAEERLALKKGIELIEAIKAELDRLNGLVEEYLHLARLPSPKLQNEEVNEIVEELVSFHKEEIVGRGIGLTLEMAPDLPPILADRNQIRQALMNLVRNACEAMSEGGTLRIVTRREADGVEISVEDTGIGIPPEDLPKVFDPFFTTKDRGTGLGLSIARQIVEDHNGSIACASTPGRGTRFTVKLPMAL